MSGAVDPLALAAEWLPTNDDPVRPQITLATTGLDGFPNARTVLATTWTDDGLSVHTDARSAKAAEVAADPRVAVVVLWPEFYRQLVVQGLAEVQSADDAAAAFAARSPYLRRLAWLNDASYARLDLVERQAVWAASEASEPDGPAAPPPTWLGIVVRPLRMVFWESSTTTASRRTEFRRAAVDAPWSVDHLPG